MNKSIVGSAAAAAVFALGIATASAQLDPKGSGAAALSPAQRSAIRVVIVERLTDEMGNNLPERLSEAVGALSELTPDQRAVIRGAIKARLGEEIREGLPQKLSEGLADRLGNEVQIPRGAAATPEQRAAIRAAIAARLAEQMQEGMPDRLAAAAATLASLSPEQRQAVLGAVRAKLAAEVKERISNRLGEEVGDKLSDKTVGSGGQ